MATAAPHDRAGFAGQVQAIDIRPMIADEDARTV
jgi:hypothetical protein